MCHRHTSHRQLRNVRIMLVIKPLLRSSSLAPQISRLLYPKPYSPSSRFARHLNMSDAQPQQQPLPQPTPNQQPKRQKKPNPPKQGKNNTGQPSAPVLSGEALMKVRDITAAPFVDTHCHLASTLSMYLQRSKEGRERINTILDFKNEFFPPNMDAVVDVHCDAPPSPIWRELVELDWVYIAAGVHPHNARDYTDAVEAQLIEMHSHPKCLAWGEMGLDYHYDNSPRDVQQEVLIRQITLAVSLGKPLVIHTREADSDIERILTSHVPREHRIHVHCFTDSPDLAERLLAHFPNLFIGITGVVTFTTNPNTAEVVRNVAPLDRLLFETDSPFMVPNNIYKGTGNAKKHGGRVHVSHSGMIPLVAQFVAELKGMEVDEVMRVVRENTRRMYGI